MSYGFQDRLTADFPSQILVDCTEVCNLACVHCPHPEFKRSPHYGGRYLDPVLNAKMTDEVRTHGVGRTQYIRYTSNGETLVHPKIYDMLDYAVRHSGTLVTLTTNGTILNERRVGKLLASGLHLIDVSIDAVRPTTYARIRVNGDLAVTQTNVIRLLELKRETRAQTSIVMSFVLQEDNADEAPEFENFWRAQGADSVVIRRLHSNAGSIGNIASALESAHPADARYPCLYPWERIVLNARGDLAFCPQDWVYASTVADYTKTTIKDVWQGVVYRCLREAHLKNDFSGRPRPAIRP